MDGRCRDEALRRTIASELETAAATPSPAVDYAAEDTALASR
jgi:hypothetical protein